MQIEYTWLTGPELARDGFLGSGGELFSFELRHGFFQLKKGVEDGVAPPITVADQAQRIKEEGYNFYIASVDAGGISLDLSSSFFAPSSPAQYPGIVVSDVLLRRIQNCCNLDRGYVIPIGSESIRAHAWKYFFPKDPDNDDDLVVSQLCRDLELWVNDLPGVDEVLRQLCERYPSDVKIPPMYFVQPPRLSLSCDVQKKWYHDTIVISPNKAARIRTRSGDIPVSSEYLEQMPIIAFEGFLVPPAAASLFKTDATGACGGSTLTCKKDVIIDF